MTSKLHRRIIVNRDAGGCRVEGTKIDILTLHVLNPRR
jgi:hypothetical protein